MSVVAVVVTHTGDRVVECVRSVLDAGGVDRVVVVDNGDDPARFDLGSCSNVSIIRTRNGGYGAAANTGFAHEWARASDAVALLNDDVVVERGWIEPLVAVLDGDDSIGAVQPNVLLAGTSPARTNSLGVELDASGQGSDIAFDTPDDPDDVAVRSIDAFTGGAVLLRRTFIDDLAGFDERLFLYYEDVDLALRGAERGWSYRCVPESRVEHAMGATTAAMADDRVRHQERNRLIVTARHASASTVVRGVWLSVRRLRHEPRRAHAAALAGGIVRIPRALVERWRARRATGRAS